MSVPHLRAALLLGLAPLPGAAGAQAGGAPAVDQLLRGADVTARVLMVGAHPDDENTNLLAWLARGRGVEAAYLSLTRGDGGQNLIGNELGEALGAIRTEELLAARRVDGARQFFTRAYDFGFSKSAEETFKHWDHEEVLGDVVTVVRAFRPHVITSVFSGTPADGHGHHQVAGIVAREAYEAAGDTVRFPVAKFGPPWEPGKLYRGGRGGGAGVAISVGEFDPVLGRSYAEVAGESRGQHRSQGFGGAAQRRGPLTITIQRQASRVNDSTPPAEEQTLFDGVDTSFARLVRAAPAMARIALAPIPALLDSARRQLDLRRPDGIVRFLAQAARRAREARMATPSCAWSTSGAAPCGAEALDLDASLELLASRTALATMAAGGITVEALAARELVAFGDSMQVNFAIHNRGRTPVTLLGFGLSGAAPTPPRAGLTIAPDGAFRVALSVSGLVDTRPWWVGGRQGRDMFATRVSPADGLARATILPIALVPGVALAEDVRRESNVEVTLAIDGAPFSATLGPILRDTADALMGRQLRPVGGVPAVTIEFDRGLQWVPAGRPVDRLMRVTLRSFAVTPRTFSFKVVAPDGIRIDSIPASVTLAPGEQREVFVRLRGMLKAGRYEFGIAAVTENGTYFEGFATAEYPHIRPIRMYRQSALYLQAVDITVPATLSVAYIQGVGDNVAPYLRDLGINTTILNPEELPVTDLSRFTTVAVGARAYAAHRELVAHNARLLDFARKGGTVVVQYGQLEVTAPGILPLPIERVGARVTEEDSPVTILEPASRLLNVPNRIGEEDWKGWVQERSLYMPAVVDPKYQAPIAIHDPGEPANKGAILATPLGKGMYVYTTLSLFRQIPGGVNGGPRLFVNLLSAGLDLTAPRRAQP